MLILLALGCLLPGAPKAAQVCDDQGVCIEIRKPASRIIPLYGALADLLLALDCGDKIAGRAVADGDNPALAKLPAIGTHIRPNNELVLALKPDLVLQMGGRGEASLQTEKLRDLGLNVLFFEISNFEQLFNVTEKLGILTGREPEAQALIANWRQRLEALKQNKPAARPTVYYEARQPNLLAAGQKNIVNAIIDAAGGSNIVNLPKKFSRFNEEQLLLDDPDFCIVQNGPMNPDPPAITRRPNLKNLSCAQKGHNFIVAEKDFARPGPASIGNAEWLAKIFAEAQ